MRVLMICTEKLPVPPIRGGAVQTYIEAVAPGLAARHELTILGVQDPRLPDRDLVGGATYVRVRGGSLEAYGASLTDHLRRHQYDLIHLFNRPKLARQVRLHAPEARLVLSLHNDMFEEHKIDPAEADEVIRQADRLITISGYVARRIAEIYPQAKPKVQPIYSAVDLHRFAPLWSEEARWARQRLRERLELGNGPVILYVGRLSPKKGVDVLIRAMPQVVQVHPGASLVLVGSKWYGADQVTEYVSYVRALAERSPAKIIASGFVSPDEVHHWFWLGDVFVCSSQWEEPLARVHYEAMAAGLPIITTDRGGNAEVVQGEGNGIVVGRCEDPVEFARALLTLLADPNLRDRMGRQGRGLAERRFSWDRVVADILSVWEAPLGQSPGPWRDPVEVAVHDTVQESDRLVDRGIQKTWEKELARLLVRARQLQAEQERKRAVKQQMATGGKKRKLSKATKKRAKEERKRGVVTTQPRPAFWTGTALAQRSRRPTNRRRRFLGR